jgi:hypothetical protein
MFVLRQMNNLSGKRSPKGGKPDDRRVSFRARRGDSLPARLFAALDQGLKQPLFFGHFRNVTAVIVNIVNPFLIARPLRQRSPPARPTEGPLVSQGLGPKKSVKQSARPRSVGSNSSNCSGNRALNERALLWAGKRLWRGFHVSPQIEFGRAGVDGRKGGQREHHGGG